MHRQSAKKHEAPAHNDATDGVRLHFIGDISLNGSFCDPQYHGALAKNMADVAARLGDCDLRIGNWEAPLWGDGGVNLLKVPRLCTTEQAAGAALPLGLDVALLANNHVYDCLEMGFENTIAFLEANGIRWVGAGRSPEEAAKPLLMTRRGLDLGILNYVGPETHPNLPPDAAIHLNMLEPDRVLADVAALARTVDVVLVALHWGHVELLSHPTVPQRRLARRIIEAGAKVVACHHAHCLQGHEPWEHGHILYGLGNFLFDGCFGGRPGRVWPRRSRRVGVATMAMTRANVSQAGLAFFFQDHLLLESDDTPARRRRQARLNRSLRLSDRSLARVFATAHFVHRTIVAPFWFVYDSGGPLRALCRIRPWHLREYARAIMGRH